MFSIGWKHSGEGIAQWRQTFSLFVHWYDKRVSCTKQLSVLPNTDILNEFQEPDKNNRRQKPVIETSLTHFRQTETQKVLFFPSYFNEIDKVGITLYFRA